MPLNFFGTRQPAQPLESAGGVGGPGGRTALNRLQLKAALVLAFGLTVGIWVFAGAHFGQRVATLENRTAAVNQRYLRAQQLLTEARNQVLLSSVYVRDALLDPTSGAADDGRARVVAALDLADGNLSRYEPILNNVEEQERIARLRREISALRRTMVDMLATTGDAWPTGARLEARRQLIARREGIMDVAGELGTLNRTEFVEHQVEMAGIYRATQFRIWQVLGLALAASLGIALVSLIYAGRLERRVGAQREKDWEMQRDLQRLSTALIRVREDERRALARELHDEIGQMLTAIKVELAVAQRTIDEAGGARDVLDDARPIVDRAMHAVRDLSHILHPAVLDDLGLPAAVDWFTKAFRRRHDIRVEFNESGMGERLTLDVETAAYRIVQEALTNVAKHSGATSCRVSLIRQRAQLLVEVEDDGKGFDRAVPIASRSNRGLGLVSMRERATQLGGTIAIDSSSGQGTRITVELPATVRGETAAPEFLSLSSVSEAAS